MATYVILTRLASNAFADPREIKQLANAVSAKIKQQCPGVTWKHSYSTLGRYDVVDVVESDDLKQVEQAALFIRALGHATTETMLATPWKEFIARF